MLSILTLFINNNTIFEKENLIKRPKNGGIDSNYNIRIDIGDKITNRDIDFVISPKRYTIDEIDEKYEYLADEIITNMLGGNESYDNINKNLKFEKNIYDGIEVIYDFKLDENMPFDEAKKYYNLIDDTGIIHNELINEGESINGYIEFYMRTYVVGQDNKYNSDIYSVKATIKGKILDEEEKVIKDLLLNIDNNNKANQNIEYVSMPLEINGLQIKYNNKTDFTFLIIFLLGVVCIILLEYKKRNDQKIIEKEKKEILINIYPKFITKLLLYLETGLTVRNALSRIANDYRVSVENGLYKNNILYDKLYELKVKLDNGANEEKVYENISHELDDRKYNRFFNMIIQNFKNGSKELSKILELEAYDSLQEKKNNIKKLGEEASTKLIMPLLLELMIIMAVIIVPAFMGF